MTEDTTGPSPPQRRQLFDGYSNEELDDILNDLPGGQAVSEATRRLYQQLLDLRRVPRQRPAPPPPPMLPGMDEEVLYAPAQLVRPEPDTAPEVGWIIRKRDPSGAAGVGYVGCYFVAPDGATVQRLFGGPPENRPRWEFYDNSGTDPRRQNTGSTVFVPIPLPQQDSGE